MCTQAYNYSFVFVVFISLFRFRSSKVCDQKNFTIQWHSLESHREHFIPS